MISYELPCSGSATLATLKDFSACGKPGTSQLTLTHFQVLGFPYHLALYS